jgi:hypothetical protein
MNRTRINSQGAQPLRDLIATYHSWNVTGDGTWNKTSWDFIATNVDMQRNLSVYPFFQVSTGADYLNSTTNVIMVSDQYDVYLFVK